MSFNFKLPWVSSFEHFIEYAWAYQKLSNSESHYLKKGAEIGEAIFNVNWTIFLDNFLQETILN